MNLSELTEKIYAEGVEKGNQEALQIVEKANAQAADIVAQAEKKAAAIVADAEAKAQELNKNTRAELKLFAEQSVSAIKTEVANIITDTVVNDSVKAATSDAKFMQSIIAALAEQMAKDGNVTIEAKDAEALTKYFVANTKGLLDKGGKIVEVKNIKTDFSIVPEKGGYKLNFGEKEFVAYFKEFLRPQLIDILF
jgi:V/A-type H+-transporting ATPase subunit E